MRDVGVESRGSDSECNFRAGETRRVRVASLGIKITFMEREREMEKQSWVNRTAKMAGLAALAILIANPNARAQGSTPTPFDKVTVSDQAAKRTLMKAVINADTARAIVDACVEWQKAQPGNITVAVFVLSPTGEIVDAHVMDGVLPIGVETSLMKAKTALYARTPSSAVAQRFSTMEGRMIRLDLGKAEGLSYYFVPGGLPIVVDNQLIGAIGVGGGNADEMCAYQALTKVLGPQPPLTPAQPPMGMQGMPMGRP